ncbi:Aldehyde/histidinol dehydrogenase [Crucibulum laeve]|uniref:Aldehyde/histidinol dehydrogenase n=1 Tax=Crucibulum laeve TaxID=68775 RepID=A0A5C3LMF9_9AGAR|nr:Aldehyde/histidinol dehydrogenase [Crucibulum laeve]
MPETFSYTWDTPTYQGKLPSVPVSLLVETTGKLITKISEAVEADVDIAVSVAQKAFDEPWGLRAPGSKRTELLWNLAQLIINHSDELAAIEALDNGKTFSWAKKVDLPFSIEVVKYFAGWADKITGQTIETLEAKFAYTRHEPIGVVGQIIPWNFPLLMFIWKIAPALATGNAIVLKPSEFTALSALLMCELIMEAGFPPGVVNVITGYGNTAGAAISSRMKTEKVAFTGRTLTGRKIMEAAAKSNLKPVTLELGGKSPNIIFDDADLEQAINWTAHGLLWRRRNCTYYIGGDRFGTDGHFVSSTIFTDAKPEMKIVKEEIFGPVGVVIKFTDEQDVIRQAILQLQAGTVWVNCIHESHPGVSFGGYKQSGIGREMGEYALQHYTNVKAVHINLRDKM